MKKLALSDEILLSVEKPSRYIGQEYNSYNKPFDPDLVRVAFCFPDVYDIATANLGMQIIYEQFNRRPDALCDRVYSPWVDLDRILCGKAPNVRLKSGDIVYVPKDNISEYNVFIRKLMPTAQLVNMLVTPATWWSAQF